MDTDIGHFIKRTRKEKGLTLMRLQKLSGVSNSYLSQIENGLFQPSPEILKKLEEPLEVSYFDLMVKAGYWDKEESGWRKDLYEVTQGESSMDDVKLKWEKEEYLEEYHVKIEKVLVESPNLYFEGALLSYEDRLLAYKILKVLFENRENSYPLVDEIENEFEEHKAFMAEPLEDIFEDEKE